ncbi:MAG: primase [Verrucomicrobiaceae bacterium]|nr:primase [Verrucomicrobiaceae bacterium]
MITTPRPYRPMSRIPEETIQQVLAATNIVDLVGKYVQLKRDGPGFKGLCPFHTEKTPSFTVSATRNTYHCFGCGVGGTAIRFLMEHDGLQFVEAVKRLAESAGIRIEEEVWDANTEREAKQRAILKKVHEDIAVFYHELLLKSPLADAARQYLKGRGLTSAVAKNWQMGYAPENPDLLRRWSAEKKYSGEILVEAGILAQADDGRKYPRLRHRLMFPIRDENGTIVAFSGRVLSADQKGGKYVNSPETPIFSKSKVLFGFDKSKRAIAKAEKVIICEGQLDVIAAFEAGVQNVSAPLGTAFTEFHVKMLKRLTKEVVLCFDADNAGYNAAEKAFKILSPEGMTVRVASLPKGEDPDSMIRKHGPEAFAAEIEKAVEFLDFQIAHKKASISGTDLRSQVQLIEQAAVTIAMNTSISARELMVRSHAGSLGISEEVLRQEVAEFVKRRAKGEAKDKEKRAVTAPDDARKFLQSQHDNALMLVSLAVAHPEVLEWLRNQDIEELHHDFPGTQMLHQVWLAHFPAGDEGAFSVFLTTLSAAEEAAFTQLLANRKLAEGGLPKAQETLAALQTERLNYLIKRARAAMKQADLSPERLQELHHQVMEWHKEYLDRMKRGSDSQ